MVNKVFATQLLTVVLLFCCVVGLSYITFNQTVFNTDTSTQTDSLSNDDFVKAGVLSSQTPNPRIPYFVGFDVLRESGLSNDSTAYIKDVITNYTLYEKKQYFAKISFVDGSFRTKLSSTSQDVGYEFKFGINDKDVQTVKVTIGGIDSMISIQIGEGDKKYSKQFTIYPPAY